MYVGLYRDKSAAAPSTAPVERPVVNRYNITCCIGHRVKRTIFFVAKSLKEALVMRNYPTPQRDEQHEALILIGQVGFGKAMSLTPSIDISVA